MHKYDGGLWPPFLFKPVKYRCYRAGLFLRKPVNKRALALFMGLLSDRKQIYTIALTRWALASSAG